MFALVETQHLHGDSGIACCVSKPRKLSPHDFRPSDRSTDHRFVQHDPQFRRIWLPESFLTAHPQHELLRQLFLARP
ncbi:MAG: hypothetical protein HOV66_06100 [Streptomycetaceae bacterium]|nr:hypothetical protein [Streptomycetaceae bacterium]